MGLMKCFLTNLAENQHFSWVAREGSMDTAQRAKGGQKIFFANHFFLQIYALTCLMMQFKYFLLGKSLISFVITSFQS